MDASTRRAFMICALAVARADGTVDPREKEVLRRFMRLAGVSDLEGWELFCQLEAGEITPEPVQDPVKGRELLRLAADVALSDDRVGAPERALLEQLARTMGLAEGAVEAALTKHVHAPHPTTDVLPTVNVVTDAFESLEAFVASAPGVVLRPVALSDLAEASSKTHVAFHAAPEREKSVWMLEKIQHAAPDAVSIAVVGRHQAFQIGYLVDAGLSRCLVEPLHDGELQRVLGELG